jgi:hypothetical protein
MAPEAMNSPLVHGYAVLTLENQLAAMPPEDLPDPESVLANLLPRGAG